MGNETNMEVSSLIRPEAVAFRLSDLPPCMHDTTPTQVSQNKNE
jgi:hypothetical protein